MTTTTEMTAQRRRAVLLALIAVAVLALQTAVAVIQLNRSPDPDVPEWLHISAADIASCTVQIQAMVAAVILVCGAAAVAMAVLRRVRDAVAFLAILAWGTATTVFNLPGEILGHRNAYPPLNYPGSADPVPVSTDFNFRAYLPEFHHLACAMGSGCQRATRTRHRRARQHLPPPTQAQPAKLRAGRRITNVRPARALDEISTRCRLAPVKLRARNPGAALRSGSAETSAGSSRSGRCAGV